MSKRKSDYERAVAFALDASKIIAAGKDDYTKLDTYVKSNNVEKFTEHCIKILKMDSVTVQRIWETRKTFYSGPGTPCW